MERHEVKRLLEYGIYLLVLIGCIAGLYWRFWYKPSVNPVIMLDPSVLESPETKLLKPMLDPAFNWILIRTQLDPPAAHFRRTDSQEPTVLKPGDKLGNWELKSVTDTTAVMARNGEERVVYLEEPKTTGP